ncbi:SLC6A19 [Cordylochernes scorpioides]|uniref:SLC6A19 n=1 Tax=Cordylochernes scorpioides TaxID=51811 RepID=A0ABY6LVS9_9ARAC|nr:SLC6A19 [Cordylochernes scorpioides]
MGTFWLENHHFPRAPEMFHDLNFSKTPHMLMPCRVRYGDFPYFVLIIFFFRGITLEGMQDGLRHLFTPDVSSLRLLTLFVAKPCGCLPQWSKLADPMVWLEAGTQIFFSLGLAFGGLIAFSSYNPVHNNCFRDALLVSICNCGTSMFAGIVVFSVLGTLTSLYCLMEFQLLGNTRYKSVAITATVDEPERWFDSLGLRRIQGHHDPQALRGDDGDSVAGKLHPGRARGCGPAPGRPCVRPPEGAREGTICLISFFLSLIFAHGGGNYVFALFDRFSGNFPLLIVALFECIMISYVYGLKSSSSERGCGKACKRRLMMSQTCSIVDGHTRTRRLSLDKQKRDSSEKHDPVPFRHPRRSSPAPFQTLAPIRWGQWQSS